MKPVSVTIGMKATEQYFPVVLFIMLGKMVWKSHVSKTSSTVHLLTVLIYKIDLWFFLEFWFKTFLEVKDGYQK